MGRKWRSRYNQRYPTFVRFIGANFAYAHLQIVSAINYNISPEMPALTSAKSFRILPSLSGPASVNIAFKMRRWRR